MGSSGFASFVFWVGNRPRVTSKGYRIGGGGLTPRKSGGE